MDGARAGELQGDAPRSDAAAVYEAVGSANPSGS